MDSFNSMKSKLDVLGIYNITEGKNIFAELKAYSVVIDELFEELDVMLRELFVDTAQTYGIDTREQLLGRTKEEFPLEQRREILKIYEQMMGGKCTVEAFEMILKGYGLTSFSILEGPTHNRLAITVNDEVTLELKKLVEEQVSADFPSHLTLEVNFAQEQSDADF